MGNFIKRIVLEQIMILFVFLGIEAQTKSIKRDTIRRELTVENTKVVSVGIENPLPINISINKFLVPKSSATYNLTNEYLPIKQLSVINNYPEYFYPSFSQKQQKGFIDIYTGLLFNCGVYSGLNVFNNKKHRILLLAYSSLTNHNYLALGRTNNIKHLFYGGDINYQYSNEIINAFANIKYNMSERNYFGEYQQPDNQHKNINTPYRRFDYFDLNIGIKSNIKDNSRWIYNINLHTYLENSKFTKNTSSTIKKNFIAVGFNGVADIDYLINADSRISLLSEIERYSFWVNNYWNNFLLNISPSYNYSSATENFRWNIKTGIGMTVDNVSRNSLHVYVWPSVIIKSTFSDKLFAKLSIGAGSKVYNLMQMDKINPYYLFSSDIRILRERLNSDIELSALLTSNLKISLYGQYNIKEQVLQFNPTIINTMTGINPVAFNVTYNNYTENILGGTISYSYNRKLTTILDTRYIRYFKNLNTLVMLPSFVANFTIDYNPSRNWFINLTYNGCGGIKYRSLSDNSVYESLPYIQSISSKVSYNVNNNLSVYIFSEISLSGNKSYIIYYPQQINMINAGLNWSF